MISVVGVSLNASRCIQAYPSQSSDPVGVVVCKQSMHRDVTNRGYIAMLSVHKSWRKRGIGASLSWSVTGFGLTGVLIASTLVRRTVEVMKKHGVEEVAAICAVFSSKSLSSDVLWFPFVGCSRDGV